MPTTLYRGALNFWTLIEEEVWEGEDLSLEVQNPDSNKWQTHLGRRRIDSRKESVSWQPAQFSLKGTLKESSINGRVKCFLFPASILHVMAVGVASAGCPSTVPKISGSSVQMHLLWLRNYFYWVYWHFLEHMSSKKIITGKSSVR